MPENMPLTRSRNSNRTLTMTPDLTVRLARPEDIEHLAELFDHYRQFYNCPPDYDAAKR